MRDGSADWTIRTASNDSCAVAWSAPGLAPAYMDSKDRAAAVSSPPRTPKLARLVIAIAPELPERMRGIPGDMATARRGEALPAFLPPSARERKPSAVDLTPGVPDSMKSWASKCERVA